MTKKSFFDACRTVVAMLFQPETMEEAVAQARTAEFDGADGIAVELGNMAPELRTVENFKALMDEIRLPFMFIDYRSDRFFGADDEARQHGLLAAAEAGAEVIDVMGDLYQPAPFELSTDSRAIASQKELIAAIHARGAKVVMSSHMPEARTAEEVLAQLQEQASRGADLCKIVTGVNREEELLEAIRTTMMLHRTLEKPFIHLCSGRYSRFHRYIAPKLGVAVTFAVHDYKATAPYNQPTICSFKAILDNFHWDIGDIR